MSVFLRGVKVSPGITVQGPTVTYGGGEVANIRIDGRGTVSHIGTDVQPYREDYLLDCTGMFVSPGWIDLHTHIYPGVTDFSVEPDEIGPATGVLTLVDAGSAGEANLAGFVRFIAQNADFPVLAYLNIGSIGLTAANRISEVAGDGSVNIDKTMDAANKFSDYVCGIKARVCSEVAGGAGLKALRAAITVAEAVRLPVIVHVGRARPFLSEVFDLLRPGDMVTHIFHGKAGNTLIEQESAVAAAVEKGILLDVGHGAASFSYRMAEHGVKKGILPHTISTDLHRRNVGGPVWDLATTISKMLAVGMELSQAIQAVTVNAAGFLRRPQWGCIEVGKSARLTLFSVGPGAVVPDATGEYRPLPIMLQPRYAILGPKIIESNSTFGAES